MRTRAAVIGALVALAFVGAVALPLATYTLSLALFGLAHVASELRYVDHRFGPRLGRRLRHSFVVLLGGVVLVRLARLDGMLQGPLASLLELGLVALLCSTVLPALWRHGRLPTLAGAGLVTALTAGLMLSPTHTLLALAVLHNATPLGFLAEALRGPARRKALLLAGGGFVALPLVIASGLPFKAAAILGIAAPEASILPAGPLAMHMGAYLPRALHAELWALHAFSAFVFMQCLHYLVVIGVLPSLADDRTRGTWLRWPSPRTFALGVAGVTAVLLVHFWLDFAEARAAYGVAAAVHAWVELPLLLLALVPLTATASTSSSPTLTAAAR